MELENRLTKAAADMVKQQDESRKALAAATAAAASAPPGTSPAAAAGAAAASAAAAAGVGPDGTPLANGDASVGNSMRRQVTGLMQQISASAPGYARMLQDSFMGPGGHAAAAAGLGGPEHVPGQEARVGAQHAGHPQETELERKTRELQVRACTRRNHQVMTQAGMQLDLQCMLAFCSAQRQLQAVPCCRRQHDQQGFLWSNLLGLAEATQVTSSSVTTASCK